ncbi:Six-hairpin glycosidase-like protein [Mariannaea sp. PMI_226]|nr:Six-hairpin glycosidase-like protein [Mariannaea sp. PMI_226]
MTFSKQILAGLAAVLSSTVVAADTGAGFSVELAASTMKSLSKESWEKGTAAEALLELRNNELSVFGPNPFPDGKIPVTSPSIGPLAYVHDFIELGQRQLVSNSAAGDPASLGVSAILIGQTEEAFLTAAKEEAEYLLNDVPRYKNGAISHRPDVAELWADNTAMSFPFLAYYAVHTNDPSLMAETVKQVGLQRAILKSDTGCWYHIIGPQAEDRACWSTGNGWAAYGMVRVLHTLQKWSGSSSMTSEAGQLKSWIKEILDCAMQAPKDDEGLLRNYFEDDSWWGEISGTALLAAAAYRMAVNDPVMFPKQYLDWADSKRVAVAGKQSKDTGIFSPAIDPHDWHSWEPFTSGSPEGQAFTVYLYTSYRDCVSASVCGGGNNGPLPPTTPSASPPPPPPPSTATLLTNVPIPGPGSTTFSTATVPNQQTPVVPDHQTPVQDGIAVTQTLVLVCVSEVGSPAPLCTTQVAPAQPAV